MESGTPDHRLAIQDCVRATSRHHILPLRSIIVSRNQQYARRPRTNRIFLLFSTLPNCRPFRRHGSRGMRKIRRDKWAVEFKGNETDDSDAPLHRSRCQVPGVPTCIADVIPLAFVVELMRIRARTTKNSRSRRAIYGMRLGHALYEMSCSRVMLWKVASEQQRHVYRCHIRKMSIVKATGWLKKAGVLHTSTVLWSNIYSFINII